MAIKHRYRITAPERYFAHWPFLRAASFLTFGALLKALAQAPRMQKHSQMLSPLGRLPPPYLQGFGGLLLFLPFVWEEQDAQSYAANGPTSLQALPASSPPCCSSSFFKGPELLSAARALQELTHRSRLSLSFFQLGCSLHFTAITVRTACSVGSCMSTGSRNQRDLTFGLCLKAPTPCICGKPGQVPPHPQHTRSQTHTNTHTTLCVAPIAFLLPTMPVFLP